MLHVTRGILVLSADKIDAPMRTESYGPISVLITNGSWLLFHKNHIFTEHLKTAFRDTHLHKPMATKSLGTE